jgi:hypothetical protein
MQMGMHCLNATLLIEYNSMSMLICTFCNS